MGYQELIVIFVQLYSELSLSSPWCWITDRSNSIPAEAVANFEATLIGNVSFSGTFKVFLFQNNFSDAKMN